jgi:hypothetical protein
VCVCVCVCVCVAPRQTPSRRRLRRRPCRRRTSHCAATVTSGVAMTSCTWPMVGQGHAPRVTTIRQPPTVISPHTRGTAQSPTRGSAGDRIKLDARCKEGRIELNDATGAEDRAGRSGRPTVKQGVEPWAAHTDAPHPPCPAYRSV